MKKLIFAVLITLCTLSANAQWSLTGNSLTTPGTNYLGTTDDKDIVFKRSNVWSGWISQTNAAFGVLTLNSTSTGGFNTAMGYSSLRANTSGSNLTGLGAGALNSNLSGSYNVGVGANVLTTNTTGSNNTGIGANSLYANLSGSDNLAAGVSALYSNYSGGANVALGSGALSNNYNGGQNIAVGYGSMSQNYSGIFNTAIGYYASHDNTGGGYNTALGANALEKNQSNYNIAIGWNALQANSSGTGNVAVGTSSLISNTTANYNVAVGYDALKLNTTGLANTSIGAYSLWKNIGGGYNTAMGLSALYNNTSGSGNTANGSSALNANTTGNNNAAGGNAALTSNTTGNNNTGFGFQAGINLTTGSNNTFLGYNTGLGIATGGGNTIIGANITGTAALTNTIIIADGNGTKRLFIDNNGRAGFGTTTPNTTLEVNSGTASISGLRLTNLKSTSTQTVTNGTALSVDANGNIILVPDVSGGAGGSVVINAGTNVTVGGAGTLISPYVIAASTGTSLWSTTAIGTANIINTNAGGVIIGTGITSAPTGYKLYVSDGILSEKVKVALKNSSNWADNVFAKDYQLLPLKEVETFIKVNKHLPGIPSADKLVSDGGIDVNVMFAKQMEKIEELTLYMIEMKKEIETLQKENAALKLSCNNTKK